MFLLSDGEDSSTEDILEKTRAIRDDGITVDTIVFGKVKSLCTLPTELHKKEKNSLYRQLNVCVSFKTATMAIIFINSCLIEQRYSNCIHS